MRHIKKVCFIAIAVGSIAIAGNKFISYASDEYNTKYINGTQFNGIDISYLTAEQALNKYIESINNLVIQINTNTGIKEIKFSDIGITLVNSDNIEDILENNLKSQDINIKTLLKIKDNKEIYFLPDVEINKDLLISKLSELDLGIDHTEIKNNKDAYISYNKESNLYEVIPEEYGFNNSLENISNNIIEFISNTEITNNTKLIINIQDLTKITDNDIVKSIDLTDTVKDLNNITNFKININVNNKSYSIDREYISDYITTNSTDSRDIHLYENYYIEYKAVTNLVSSISKGVTTMGLPHKFTTHAGNEITVPGGNWGWWLNSSETANIICNKLQEVLSTQNEEYTEHSVSEVSWYQTAPYYGDKEFVNYVEIDLTNQHLYLYKDGELQLDCGIVSGLASDPERVTPPGIFKLTYKQLDATLTGENYSTPVKYWMTFNGDIGIHDATWQPSFGGNAYTYRGSHGCINVSLEAAKQIYSLIDESYAIICYK